MSRKWRIVGFDHPHRAKSILYKQDLTDQQLIKALRQAIAAGGNLFSIRGFRDGENVDQKLKGGD